MDPFRRDRGAAFYVAALSYAQSLWLEGKPAQALLQLNKAFAADLSGDDPVLRDWPPPFAAKSWIMAASRSGSAFLGNPVRHYQHLATRMNNVNPVPRRWRAWACFHLAEAVLGPGYERDARQVELECIVIPTPEETEDGLRRAGWPDEDGLWVLAMRGSRD